MKVLVIEDNPVNMELLVQLLEDDYELITAENGQIGLDKLRAEQPDLVLLDLSMPVMDGWEVLRHIQADPALKATPVVVISAHAMTADRDAALAAGATDFLTKPVDDEKLFDLLERLLP